MKEEHWRLLTLGTGAFLGLGIFLGIMYYRKRNKEENILAAKLLAIRKAKGILSIGSGKGMSPTLTSGEPYYG